MSRITIDEIIGLMGGPYSLASRLGLTGQAVSMWRSRGVIPGRHHMAIYRALLEKGIEVDLSDIVALGMDSHCGDGRTGSHLRSAEV